MAGLIGSNITAPKMMDTNGLLGSGAQTGGIDPAPQTTAMQRKLKSMYNTNTDLTNEANWQGNKYTGPTTTYTGKNGQSTASAGYQLGGGFDTYMSQYDPDGVTADQMRAGMTSGAFGYKMNDAQINDFLARPNAAQQYQSLAASQAPMTKMQDSNAAGAAASASVNTARNADFQGTLNAMYGPNDPRRIASNYSEQKVNGQYIGPATNLPVLNQANYTSFSPVPPGGTPTATPTPTNTPTPTPAPIGGNPGSGGQTPTPTATPTPTTGGPDPLPGSPSPTTENPPPQGWLPGWPGVPAPVAPGVTPGGATSSGTSTSESDNRSYGYNASLGGAVNSQATGYDAAQWAVTPEQQVEDRLNRILGDPDSSLMKQAKTQAMQASNSKGLLNSSMAATAGEDAMIRAALPIAQQDAQTNANAAQTNAGATNNSRAFTAGAQNTSSGLNAQLGTQANLTNSGEINKASSFTASAKNAAEALRVNTDSQKWIKQLDVNTQKELQSMFESNKQLIQTNATAAELNKSFAQNMLQIQSSTMTAEAKKAAIDGQIIALNNGLDTIGHIIGFNLGKYWKNEDGTPKEMEIAATGGTGTNPTTNAPTGTTFNPQTGVYE